MYIGKKNILVTVGLACLLLALLVMAGCSSTSTTTAISTVTVTQTSSTTATVTTTSTTVVVPVELNVSAATSLTDALPEIDKAYTQANTHIKIVANFAASGTLQTQIEQGAPADVFISAAAKQMNALQTGGLIIEDTRQDLLKNRIVLVVPANSTLTVADFTGLLDDGFKKVAIGDPDSVPAGTYAKQAFDKLGIYEQLQPKLILCADVRQVLSYVESGDVEAGIVYSTDAATTDKVKIVAEAPADIKIVYPVAVIKASKNVEAAKAYIDFLLGAEAGTIFEKYGFVVIDK